MIVEKRRTRAHIDLPLILMVGVMAVFGVYCVAVATYSTSSSPDGSILSHIVESSYALRQCLFLLIAPVVVGFLMSIRYDVYKRYAAVLYFGAVALVALVWLANRATGVKQWLDILWGFTIQPTEFAKLAIILMLSRELGRREVPMNSFRDAMWLLGLVIVPGIVIIASGEMGSFLVIAFVFAIMLFFSGTRFRTLMILVLISVLGVLAIYGYAVASGSDNYRVQRILAFFDPASYSSSAAYQQTQSKIAIGSGGFSGVGRFVDGAMYQLNYVPADWTDFIFATIGEAFGFVGCVAMLILYLMIILRMAWLAFNTRDKFGRLVITGVMGMLLFHVFENVAMTLGLMPITGIPLPFISYGGSNMVTNMGGVGLVLNVTKNRSMTANLPEAHRRFGKRRHQIYGSMAN